MPCHGDKGCDAVFGRGVGREQRIPTMGVQRVDDEHMGQRRIGLGLPIVDTLGEVVDLAQCRGKPQRLTADLCADAVGLVLAAA